MAHTNAKKKLIANAIKARAARKLAQEERIRKQILQKKIQRHYAMTSALYILSQVALG